MRNNFSDTSHPEDRGFFGPKDPLLDSDTASEPRTVVPEFFLF